MRCYRAVSYTHLDVYKRQVFIIAVPTPIDRYHNPELSPLEKASVTVGELLSHGDIVVYESTVYPGVTEEYCVPTVSYTHLDVYKRQIQRF